MIPYAICILIGVVIGVAYFSNTPYEPTTLEEELADAAVKYCEYRRMNRMESFQRAAWDDYVAVAEEITMVLHHEARQTATPAPGGYVEPGAQPSPRQPDRHACLTGTPTPR